MKLLVDEGSFEILSKTEDVIWHIATAARTCYKSFGKQSAENDIKLVKNIIKRGHGAMLEFGDMTVKFDDISRGFTHEQVRHRLCSFAQESTRYVDESDLNVVAPPHLVADVVNYEKFTETLQQIETTYRELKEAGWKNEDARQLLPIGIKAPLCVKANIKEWRHIFFMRCDRFAHWEIRKVMVDLLVWCQANIPIVFDDFHIFELENGQRYARPIKDPSQILNDLKDYINAGEDFFAIVEQIETVINDHKEVLDKERRDAVCAETELLLSDDSLTI